MNLLQQPQQPPTQNFPSSTFSVTSATLEEAELFSDELMNDDDQEFQPFDESDQKKINLVDFEKQFLQQSEDLGISVQQALQIAVENLQKAAESGSANAQMLLGDLFQQGYGKLLPPDLLAAIDFYCMAGKSKEPEGYFKIALIYDQGKGGLKQPALAFDFFKKAAQLGHPEAQLYVGDKYRSGEGIPQNHAQAVQCYFNVIQTDQEMNEFPEEAWHRIESMYQEGTYKPGKYDFPDPFNSLTCLEKISDQFAQCLIDILDTNPNITTVNLGTMRVTGLQKFMTMLETNKNITRLDLSYSIEADDSGCSNYEVATLCAKALTSNTTLKTIDLSGNSLDSKSIATLIEACKTNPKITFLLWNVEMNEEDRAAVEHLNTTFKQQRIRTTYNFTQTTSPP